MYLKQTRIIPIRVKVEVWKRDYGCCVICGSKGNLHFDHDIPYSKGGSSITTKNVRLQNINYVSILSGVKNLRILKICLKIYYIIEINFV